MKSGGPHVGIVVSVFGAIMIATSGCALTSKAEVMSIRWFNPETVKPRVTSAERSGAQSDHPLKIEIGRISSGINLRDKIAYRDSAFEVGFYDDKRWTERPEVYVRREVARALFEERGFERALSGQGPVLDIELLSFEEVRGPSPSARIQLRILVHEDTRALLERTILVDKPIAPPNNGIDSLVLAMSEALAAAAADVARDVTLALRATTSG